MNFANASQVIMFSLLENALNLCLIAFSSSSLNHSFSFPNRLIKDGRVVFIFLRFIEVRSSFV